MKIIKISIYLFALFTILHFSAFSQDKIIVISDKVGEKIDSAENALYRLHIYPQLKEAVAYYEAKDKYYMDIKSSGKDTLVEVTLKKLVDIALEINYGVQTLGSLDLSSYKYRLDTTGSNYKLVITGIYNDRLDHISETHVSREPDPIVGVGLGLSYSFTNMDPVKTFFDYVENYFISKGIPLTKNQLNFDASRMYNVSLYARLFGTFGLEAEYAKCYGSDFDMSTYSVSAKLMIPLSIPKWMRLYGLAGIAEFSYYIENNYNGILVDPEKSGRLEKIFSDGQSKGLIAGAGLELAPSSHRKFFSYSADVFVRYLYYPQMEYQWDIYSGILKVRRLTLGIGLKLYY